MWRSKSPLNFKSVSISVVWHSNYNSRSFSYMYIKKFQNWEETFLWRYYRKTLEINSELNFGQRSSLTCLTFFDVLDFFPWYLMSFAIPQEKSDFRKALVNFLSFRNNKSNLERSLVSLKDAFHLVQECFMFAIIRKFISLWEACIKQA